MAMEMRKAKLQQMPLAAPTPERIMEMAWGFAPSRALVAAIDIGLFTEIAGGKNTLAGLQQATGASQRGLRMLLEAMLALGLLKRQGAGNGARYSLPPDVDAFLVEDRAGYQGEFIRLHSNLIEDHWRKLTDCVRTGRPVVAVDIPEEGAPFWQQLVDPLFTMNYAAARRLAEELSRLYPQPIRVLDVAAGSGVWGIAAAQVNPAARVVAFDLPETLPHARRKAQTHGVADRFEFSPGDIRRDQLGLAEFEVVVLGNICHSEGVAHTRELLAKVAQALKPGGAIAIADFIPDDDRSGPPLPLLFALNMLVHTSEGDTFTFSDYAAWLKEAGFGDVRKLQTPSPSPLILATRL